MTPAAVPPPAPEGLLLLDKPAGPTSHDVVARVRRLTGQRRVGHAGTLDPAATGLLPLVLGRATRLVRFLPASPKVYRGRLRLGLTTSTDDAAGEPLTEHRGPLPKAAAVREAAARLRGRLLQVAPAVSARKVDGQRLYRLARRGQRVLPEPTPVDIERFELAATDSPAEWTFEAHVSSGTYVRALVRDLGAALGCGGTLWELRRVAIGPLRVERAVAVDGLDALETSELLAAVIPLHAMPLVPPPVRLADPAAARAFAGGGAVHVPGVTDPGAVRVLGANGELLGIGEAAEGRVRPRVVVARTPTV